MLRKNHIDFKKNNIRRFNKEIGLVISKRTTCVGNCNVGTSLCDSHSFINRVM